MTAPRDAGLGHAVRVGLSSLRSHPWLAIIFFSATLAQGVLQGLIVWVLRKVLLVFSSGTVSAGTLAWGAGLVLGTWFLRIASTIVGEVASVRLAHRLEIEAMQRVLAKLLGLSVRFLERNSQADLAMASYHDVKAVRTITLDLGTVVLSASRIVGLALVTWLLSPWLALIGLIVIPLGAVPAFWLGQRITQAARAERECVTSLYDSFLQVSAGIRVIKVNRGEPQVLQRAAAIGHDLYRHVVKQAQARNVARLLLEVVSGIGLVAVLVVGGHEIGRGELSWQSLLSLLVAILGVYAPILNLLAVYTAMRSAIPSLDRVEQLLREPQEVADRPGARAITQAPATITLDHLSFGYDTTEVLQDINATFHRGEKIGIVGPSGAGKSTLVALLLRLYDPTRGRILFNETDIRELRHADLLAQCAIVPQEPVLFIDTIANNIRFARPDASLDEVVAAAKAANIHDEILLSDFGYDTILGRHREGRGLSVGQKQRLCIAAAVLKNAPILFLDEATSSLDSLSERAVQAALERLMTGRSSFIVAHRLSTLRSVDRILVLNHGQMVGLGTHEELITTCPTYQHLWAAQLASADTGRTERMAPAASR